MPSELPYTLASLPFRGELAEANAEGLKVPLEEQRLVFPDEREAMKVRMAKCLHRYYIGIHHPVFPRSLAAAP